MSRAPTLTGINVVPSDPPVAADVLAQAIVDISEGMKKLNASRLTRDTIILLLHDSSHVGKRDIGYVLASLDQLERTFLKPKVKP